MRRKGPKRQGALQSQGTILIKRCVNWRLSNAHARCRRATCRRERARVVSCLLMCFIVVFGVTVVPPLPSAPQLHPRFREELLEVSIG